MLNSFLTIFDKITSWMKTYACNLSSNGSKCFMKREKFINNMTEKIYYNKIIMQPKVCEIHLSSDRITNVVTFSFKNGTPHGNQWYFCFTQKTYSLDKIILTLAHLILHDLLMLTLVHSSYIQKKKIPPRSHYYAILSLYWWFISW